MVTRHLPTKVPNLLNKLNLLSKILSWCKNNQTYYFFDFFVYSLKMSDSILLGAESIQNRNISSSEHKIQATFAVITIAVNIISAILNVIINGLLLHVHIKNRKSPSRILICNMTVTDFLTGLIVQPAYAAHIIIDLNGHPSYSALLFFNFTAYLVCGMSLVTAGGMSIDRLFATIRPFSYKFYGKPRIYVIMVVFIWSQGFTFVSLYTADVINRAMAQTAFMLTVIFAVISFVVSYAIIITSIRKRERRITNSGLQGPLSVRKQSTTQQNQRNKITKTFALMIIALCAMYLPMFVVKIFVWRAKSSQLVVLNIANRLSNTVTFLNSLLNPVLYCYSNVNSKRQVKDLLSAVFVYIRGDSIRPVHTERVTRHQLSNAATSIS